MIDQRVNAKRNGRSISVASLLVLGTVMLWTSLAGLSCGDNVASGNCASVDCSDLDDECNEGVCDPTSGSCLAEPHPSGTTCGSAEDDDCTNPDSCDGAGTCQPNNEPDGAACNDGLACNTEEFCLAGVCSGGSPHDCSGTGDQCNADSSCDPDGEEGNCDAPGGAAHEGDPCDDGNPCDAGETCQSGSCVGGLLVDCTGSGGDCREDSSCDSSGIEGNCDIIGNPINEGQACDDGQACLTGETCTDGECAGSSPVDCSGTGDECSADSECDPAGAEGNCAVTGAAINEGQQCDDGDICTTQETCQAGACAGGLPVDCSDLDDECNLGVCNATSGECELEPRAEGTSCGSSEENDCTSQDTCDAEGVCQPNHAVDGTTCDDGDVCNTAEACLAGACSGGALVDCSGTGDLCNADSSCDPAGSEGNCDTPGGAINEGLDCDDMDVCNVGETCQAGACIGGASVDCLGTGDQCNLDSSCDPAGLEGNCDTPGGATNEGQACDDGDVCNVGEQCQVGTCTGGAAVNCQGTGGQCREDSSCDPVGSEGNCDTLGATINEGQACGDGDVCNVGEACQAGSCTGGLPADCSGTGDQCNADNSCDPAGSEGNCDVIGGSINEGQACDDSQACNVGEICQAGACTGGGTVNCSGTGDQCNADSICDSAGLEGNCDTPGGAINEGLTCDDGNVCLVGETCQNGTCMGSLPVNCFGTGDQCNADNSCDPAGSEGNCDVVGGPTNEGLPCSDGDSCNVGETCLVGLCLGGIPMDCSGTGDLCNADSSCDSAGLEGNCDIPGMFINEGLACDDGNACLLGETCLAGACNGVVPVDCSGTGDQCRADWLCDPAGAEGNCAIPGDPINEGLACDDGTSCTLGEICQSGTCGGGGPGICTPDSTSACPDACGLRTCSSSCTWGACNFTKDIYEPNENWSQATYLGAYNEGDSIPPITNAWLHQYEPPIGNPGEIDRYYINVVESGNIFDWTMVISATLSGVSGWHHLCIFYDRGCNGSVDVEQCTSGTGVLNVTTGDVDSNDGGDDDGCVDVEVYGDWSCSAYTLSFSCD
jgi:hypothetical protein